MMSDKNRSTVLDQISNLRICSDKIRENLSSIQLLMADSDYGRIKDHSVSNELEGLIKQVDSLTHSIDAMEKKLI